MKQSDAKQILDEVVGQVFGYQNPLSLERAMTKFAFDVRLPQQVFESETGNETWAASMGQQRYIVNAKVMERAEQQDGLKPHRQFMSIDDVLAAWNEVNYASSERQIDSKNVLESDGVYHSDKVYRSIDIRKSKNILFSDGVDACDHVVAGQTSKSCQYTIRVEDSKNVSSSFNVIWSNKIQNSMFIQDCFDLEDCLFCTHLIGKKFCVANVQLDEVEYRRVKDMVARWALQS